MFPVASHGVGGMAERRPTQLPSPYDSPDNRHNIEKIIAYNKEVENKLHVIRPQLQQCMPGRLMQLDQQSILIHRELHARLWYDTLYNIDRLDKNIQQTTSDLNQLQQKQDAENQRDIHSVSGHCCNFAPYKESGMLWLRTLKLTGIGIIALFSLLRCMRNLSMTTLNCDRAISFLLICPVKVHLKIPFKLPARVMCVYPK
ncbi:hypothetical protein PCI56_03020 [Plesiomonas shigelloides subsp. oncorhynchi]|nr:hypothetical protein [Plesiomonas shigelloides]